MAPTSVRLDPETESLLERLANRRRATRSDVLREALHRLAEAEEADADGGPYAMVEDLIGAADDGPATLAEDHKRAFRELLSRRAREP